MWGKKKRHYPSTHFNKKYQYVLDENGYLHEELAQCDVSTLHLISGVLRNLADQLEATANASSVFNHHDEYDDMGYKITSIES